MRDKHMSMYFYEYLFPSVWDENGGFFTTCRNQCTDLPINAFFGVLGLVFFVLGVIYSDSPYSNTLVVIAFVSMLLKQSMFILNFDIGIIKLIMEQDTAQLVFLSIKFIVFIFCFCTMFDRTVFLRFLAGLTLLMVYPCVVFVDANTSYIRKVQYSYVFYTCVGIGGLLFLAFANVDKYGFKSDPISIGNWDFYPLIVSRYCLLTIIYWMGVYGYVIYNRQKPNSRVHALIRVRTSRRLYNDPAATPQEV